MNTRALQCPFGERAASGNRPIPPAYPARTYISRTNKERETERLYDAVLKLRRAGNKLYKIRNGLHEMNGAVRTSTEIFEMAEGL